MGDTKCCQHFHKKNVNDNLIRIHVVWMHVVWIHVIWMHVVWIQVIWMHVDKDTYQELFDI